MRQMDSLGLKLCTYQALLFECSIDKAACSSPIFIRRFMNSALAKRMDNAAFLYESTDITNALTEIEEEYGSSSYGQEKYTHEELHWIGYIYRYWCYVYDKPSRFVYKIIKPGELKKLYFPYHSLDPLQAIERILEITGSEKEFQPYDIIEGARILRKVRNKYTT